MTFARELLTPFLDAWLRRNERSAVRQAGELMFWRDGMLKELELIAQGKATDETFNDLRTKLEDTEGDVVAAIQELTKARSKLSGTKIAEQIDKIVHDSIWGKTMTRLMIEDVLQARAHGDDPANIRNLADHLCRNIKTFNAEVQRLNRMVNES
jgi:hypothetical protein